MLWITVLSMPGSSCYLLSYYRLLLNGEPTSAHALSIKEQYGPRCAFSWDTGGVTTLHLLLTVYVSALSRQCVLLSSPKGNTSWIKTPSPFGGQQWELTAEDFLCGDHKKKWPDLLYKSKDVASTWEHKIRCQSTGTNENSLPIKENQLGKTDTLKSSDILWVSN